MTYLITSGVWRHYLFDVEMFTHVDLTTSETFTTGETLTGASGVNWCCYVDTDKESAAIGIKLIKLYLLML